MKRRLLSAARLYPRAWRDRYGDEFEALLDSLAPTWRDTGDIVLGALHVHFTNSKSYLKLSALLGAIGLMLGAAASFTGEKRYVSTGVVRVESDPGRDSRFQDVIMRSLSRQSLAEIIQRPSLDLYREDRARYPMEDVVQAMRNRDIRIRPREDGTIEVSMAYTDPKTAEATTRVLMNRLAMETDTVARNRADFWKRAWPNDEPPPLERLALVSEPQLPDRPVRSWRPMFLALGTAGGLLAAWLLWRPRRNLKLAGFALLGAGLAIAGSFLIRDRYVSSVVIRFDPPQAPKRLWSTLAAETPAQRFDRLQRHVLGTSAARDLRVDAVGQDAFQISFTSTDPHKAQAMARELITRLLERHIEELKAFPTSDPGVRRALEMAAGPRLVVLDPASLPESPVFPNRLVIGAAGLPVGLVAGVFFMRRKRPVQAA